VARLVGCYTLVVTLVALWTGSFVLGFFSITLPAMRVAGGLMIAVSAWDLLRGADAPDEAETRVRRRNDAADVALVPLTMPLTAGPGMITLAVALGSEHPESIGQGRNELAFFIGLSLAAIAMSFAIWQIFRSAQWIIRRVTPSGLRTLNRLIGFLLLCIGVQIMITGVEGVLGPLLAAR
jgi:multiple antibiotic resistance protein